MQIELDLLEKIKHLSFSKFAITLTIVFVFIFGFENKKWADEKYILQDARNYYSYLPAVFIYKDLTFKYRDQLPEKHKNVWHVKAENGNLIARMTMGTAILWAPFFLFAHAYASISADYENNGFSVPYQFALFVAAVFYLFLGLIFLRKILLNYFDEITVAITLLLIVFGTNLLNYVIIEAGMTHVYSFSIISLFVYLSIKWIKKPNTLTSILLGLSLGVITLIRPVNMVIVFFLLGALFLHIIPVKNFKDSLARYFPKLVLTAMVSFIVVMIQSAYWKIFADKWLFYAYGDQGFFFDKPQFLNGLFSFRKGWLLYTPIMSLGIIGLFFMKGSLLRLRWPIALTTFFYSYIVFSWWCWWYGGSFSARPMIDIYGLLSIPLAAAIYRIVHLKLAFRSIIAVGIGFLFFLNLFQSAQYSTSLLHFDSMTKEVYFKIWFKKGWPAGYDEMVQKPDYKAALLGKEDY